MDEKLRSVLEDEELLSKIAAAVRGTSAQSPQAAPEISAAPQKIGKDSSDAIALLAALKPFLRKERQDKLDAVTKAMSVASVYKSVKNI